MIIAKILSLLYAGLFTVFALLSGTDSAKGIKGIILNLPNIAPWLLVWAAVFVVWKKPKVGGILFLALAVVSILFFHTYEGLVQFSIISFPLFVIGILFLAKQKKRGDYEPSD